VLDKGAASSERAIAELESASTREHLLRYATWRTQDPDRAKDLFQEAASLVLDPDRKPWDDPSISFRRHMRRVMDDIAIEIARSAPARLEINASDLVKQPRPGKADDDADDDPFPDPWDGRPWTDDELHDRRTTGWLRDLWRRIEPGLRATDPLAVHVYEAACKNQETPAEQAAHLGVPVEEVYEALRRLKYRAAIAMAEWKKEEAQRMFEARQHATSAKKKGTPA
jgi:DNA-directed RNA polymerase specialized sigma24 family protein